MKTTVAQMVLAAVTRTKRDGKTQAQMAREAGFNNQNMITMIKQGRTKLPLDKAPTLAVAVGLDPDMLVRTVLQEYMPHVWAVLVPLMARDDNEKEAIEKIREEA